ncbi:MAG: membrane protein insertion efficiency factor YidD [Kiritimatiellaeota bacterium]|nr:membrane protein insertion efficiency factor YidD [Kiritimatiellota bacterium]
MRRIVVHCLLLCAGALSAGAQLELAAGLCAEGQWRAGRREAQRVLTADPQQPLARLLTATAGLRLGQQDPALLAALQQLADGAAPVEISARAAYELGRVRWRQGDATNACVLLQRAFRTTQATDLFLRSGCALRLLADDFPELGERDPALLQALQTCAPLWTPEIRRECRPVAAPAKTRITATPAAWIVALYRRQIRPALGSRCALTPSCSEYFLEAGRQHGLLAFPLAADRLIREPSVVQAQEHPVQTGAQTRYADPLAEHDGWLKGAKK